MYWLDTKIRSGRYFYKKTPLLIIMNKFCLLCLLITTTTTTAAVLATINTHHYYTTTYQYIYVYIPIRYTPLSSGIYILSGTKVRGILLLCLPSDNVYSVRGIVFRDRSCMCVLRHERIVKYDTLSFAATKKMLQFTMRTRAQRGGSGCTGQQKTPATITVSCCW